ncbi:WD repeat-containing protein 13 [Ananas comosus]|uniref:WD repeat-containing protein 13 n=1 Tax=Ananas comosus TaxID=4615 RepID=A0A6P5F109_ANACO|nr:WD repeat-containing protein 13 [Ananas comosus]
MEEKGDEPAAAPEPTAAPEPAVATAAASAEETEPTAATEEAAAAAAADPDFVSCLLQPPITHHNADYVAIRRLLLHRKALSSAAAIERRKDWRCNGRGYVAYRNFLRRPKNWESQTSQPSTPGHSGRWASFSAPQSLLFETDSWSSSRDLRSNSQAFSRRLSFGSSISDSDHQTRFAEPAYSFVGMHCIFDNCKASVVILKFGHMSSDLLAYGATDGSLTICQVSEPPSVLQQLRGHSKAITDFDFSSNNQYIASSSMDKTVRVWEISKGHCIRVVYGVSSQLCIRFHPVNNNLLLVGNANKEISVINFSTGRVISKLLFEDKITAMDNDHTGQLIFAGDAQGYIYTVSVNSHTGSVSRSHKNKNSRSKSPITTIQYRTFSLVARCPVVLVCAQDGNICFFSVALEIQGYLTLLCSLKLAPRVHSIRASFCPLLSLEKGEFIVSGSEDSNVYFYDLTRPKHACVNKLQGHGAPVIGVAWNHGENLLASSDSDGTVIVWKRAKD